MKCRCPEPHSHPPPPLPNSHQGFFFLDFEYADLYYYVASYFLLSGIIIIYFNIQHSPQAETILRWEHIWLICVPSVLYRSNKHPLHKQMLDEVSEENLSSLPIGFWENRNVKVLTNMNFLSLYNVPGGWKCGAGRSWGSFSSYAHLNCLNF